MNPYSAYKQNSSLEATIAGWPRVDLLLTLYDKAIAQLEEGIAALRKADTESARAVFLKARLTVLGLAAGAVPQSGVVADNLLRLYEFVLHAFQEGNLEKLNGALKVLKTLREGFEGIRSEAIQLERAGEIPPANLSTSITVVA
jgi:flagellin-specific chaperone FliS